MRRLLLAGCLMLALASAASTQIVPAPDDALSPMEQLAGTPTPAAAKPDAAPDAAKASTSAKAEPAKKADADAKPEPVKPIDHMAQCMRDWDRGTHMTRQQWNRTCRRVVSARSKFTDQMK